MDTKGNLKQVWLSCWSVQSLQIHTNPVSDFTNPSKGRKRAGNLPIVVIVGTKGLKEEKQVVQSGVQEEESSVQWSYVEAIFDHLPLGATK